MKINKPAPRPPKTARSTAKKSATTLSQLVHVLKHPRPMLRPVPLKLRAPAAREVFVAGSFNGWKVGATPLRPANGGEWLSELKLSPGRYEYLFVVDGCWLPDPAAPETAPNPFGGWNSVLSVN